MTLVDDSKGQMTARLLEMIGDPEQVRREMRSFAASAEWLSENSRRLLDALGEQWVAVRGCEVRAHAPAQRELLARAAELGLPRHETVMRRLRREQPKAVFSPRRS